ncbi:hypothetical protein GH714_043159 [Hevea brasiliensis]|uniref:Uncharacterized protein n=1 Tax=Hevea brasiliensis TaxID=3981 RepID=A0A6A6K1U9_HEVBR|nr:hypothetical protein GH714_043159 [Hevea brasiliensis]
MAAGKEEEVEVKDELAESLNDIFTSVSTMVKGELESLSNSATQVREETPVKQVDSSEPKIVVIMAGDENPTYLAKPKPVSCDCHNEEQV